MKKNILLILSLFWITSFSFSQTEIHGTVTDGETGEQMIGASVLIKKNKTLIASASTDIDGGYRIKVDPGTYDVEVSYTGYSSEMISGVLVIKGTPRRVDVKINSSNLVVSEIIVSSASKARVSSSRKARRKDRKARRKNKKNKSTRSPTIPIKGSRTNSPSFQLSETEEHGSEEYSKIVENEFLSTFKKPLSTFSIDVDKASYSNTRRFLNNNQMPPKDAVRIEEFINYFSYEYPQPQGADPFSINTEISDCPWNDDHKLAHIGLQGYELPTGQMPPSNLVFLLDVSGSMSAKNKLPLLKRAFKLLVQQLRDVDKVSIVVYAGASGLVLPPTSGGDKNKIMEALDNLSAGGSTAGAAGIKLAYKTARKSFVKKGNNRIILATDGDFNVGTSSTSELVRLIEKKRKSGISISILGFGMGNYKDSRMEQIADNGNGNYAYIDNFQEAKKVFVEELSGTLHTIAKDVKLQIEFNPLFVKEYRLVGYVNRKLKDEDFDNDEKDAGDLGAGHSVTALYEIIPATSKKTRTAKKDGLKYQDHSINEAAKTGSEWMTIKLRYKKPKGKVSKLIEVVAKDTGLKLKSTSKNFRFSAAVASFGMLLRDSQFKGDANFNSVLKLAKKAKGKDEFGYRKEFISLVKKAKKIDSNLTAKK